MEDFGFIIPSYCEDDIHLTQLLRCLNSIRRFHPNNTILVIDDYSKVNLDDKLSSFDNIKVIKSFVKGAGDMVTFDVFRKTKLFKKAVIFQDSMTLESELVNIEDIEDISYIWYFTNHRLYWHIIPEPKNEYNIKNNINVHDDAVMDSIKNFITNENFKKYALDMYPKKDEWSGCFGCLGIIDIDFLEILNNETGIIDFLSNMDDNRKRRVAESIFALACKYVLGDSVFEKAYDGLYWDGKNEQRNKKMMNSRELGFDFNMRLDQVCKNDYFSKISFNRNL